MGKVCMMATVRPDAPRPPLSIVASVSGLSYELAQCRKGWPVFRSSALLLSILALTPPLMAQTKPAPRPAPKPAPARPAPRRPAAPAPKVTPAAAPALKPLPPDLQLSLVHTSGGTSTLSTVQLKGPRARISVGDNLASIQQCDSRQSLQLNTQARTFRTAPFDDGTTTKAALDARKRGARSSIRRQSPIRARRSRSLVSPPAT